MKHLSLFILLSFLTPLHASYVIDLSKSKNKVEFLAVGRPKVLKIKGELKEPKDLSGKLKIEENKLTGETTLQLKSLDTGIEMRNDHMKNNYLHVSKHPEAKLKIEPISIPKSEQPSLEVKENFKGILTLHGVEKPIEGKSALTKKDGKWAGQFEFGLNLEDFKIEIPSYLGITVSKEVTVKVDIQE